jgi:hypothetical protein
MNLAHHAAGRGHGVKINGTDVIQILLNLAVNAFQCAPLPHRVESAAKCCARRWI